MIDKHGDGARRQGDGATSVFGLGGFKPEFRLRLFQAPADLQDGLLQIHVRPSQGQQLAPPHPGCKREAHDRAQPRTRVFERVEDSRNLIGV